jgi:hypothetical protein
MSNVNVRLSDLMSGVVSVENTDGFPLESMPPQGSVTVTFASGRVVEMGVNQAEYTAAKFQLSAPDAIKEATKKALASFFATPEDYLGKQYLLMDHLRQLYGWTRLELAEERIEELRKELREGI